IGGRMSAAESLSGANEFEQRRLLPVAQRQFPGREEENGVEPAKSVGVDIGRVLSCEDLQMRRVQRTHHLHRSRDRIVTISGGQREIENPLRLRRNQGREETKEDQTTAHALILSAQVAQPVPVGWFFWTPVEFAQPN